MKSPRHTVRRVVVTLLVFAAILLTTALISDTRPAIEWSWLQAHAHQFYAVKGILAGTAVVLLIAHMNQVWAETMLWGQRLRYLSLFWLVAWVAGASVEQVQQDALVNSRNVGGMIGAGLVVVAMVVSIRDTRREKRPLA